MTAPNVVVVGHLDVDRVETDAGSREELLGGSGLYTALAASANRAPVGLIGTISADYPLERFEEIADGRLETDFVRVLGSQRRNTIDYTTTTDGPADRVSHGHSSETWQRKSDLHAPRHVPRIVGPETSLLHLSPMYPKYQRLYADWAKEQGLTVSLDTSEYYAANHAAELQRLVEDVDLALLSDVEATLLYSEFPEDPRGHVRQLVDETPEVVLVRQGEDGCLVGTEDTVYDFDAHSTSVVDPTGAGDSFNGGFVSRYHETGVIDSCRYGIATATTCIEAFGNEGLLAASRADIERIAATVTYE